MAHRFDRHGPTAGFVPVLDRERRPPRIALLLMSVSAAALLYACPAGAQTYTWVPGSGIWGNPFYWEEGVVPDSPTATALFRNPAAAYGVFLNGSYSINQVIFEGGGPAGARYVVSVGSLTFAGIAPGLTFGAAAPGVRTAEFAADVPLTLLSTTTFNGTAPTSLFYVGGPMGGPGGLTKLGPGVLELGAANVYTGGTSIQGGTLRLSGAGTLPSTGAVSINTGATLDLGTAPDQTISSLSGSSGSMINLGSRRLTVGDPLNTTFAGGIVGTGGGLMKQGTGTLTLTASNSYTGGTIVNSGALVAAASGALGTGTVTVNGDTASLSYDGAGVTAAAAPIILNDSSRLSFGNGASAGSATITIAADATPSLGAGLVFTQTSTAGNAQISNALAPAYNGVTFRGSSSAGSATIQNSNGSVTSFQNTSSAASATITNLGNGATFFDGSSSAGSSVITNQATGRTYFSFNASGGNARIINNAGGTLDISGLTSAGTTLGSIEGAGTFALGTKALTVGFNGLTTTVSGTISGAGGSLTKVGTSTLTLSGANTYSGGTSVLTGTLEIQNAAALGSGGVTLNGGQLRSTIAGTATLANPLSITNVGVLTVAPNQTLNINLANVADGATVMLGSASDTGTLVATGSAIAAGSSTVEINGGTVRAGSVQLPTLLAAARRTTIAGGATLDLAGYGATIRDLYGTGTLTGSGSLQIAGGDFDGRLTGAVGLDKISADPLNLDGVSTYTGPTTVRAGYLGVNGSLVSAVSVLNNAALGGSGTIGGLAVQGGGTVAPGNSIGTLSVNGNVSFAPGSVYAVEINAAGQSDRLAATGT
ncbi:beta strand repeat-containing protein, partial [Microvirga puerhi]